MQVKMHAILPVGLPLHRRISGGQHSRTSDIAAKRRRQASSWPLSLADQRTSLLVALWRIQASSSSEDEKDSEEVQNTLVDILNVQIGYQRVKDLVVEQSAKLTETAEQVSSSAHLKVLTQLCNLAQRIQNFHACVIQSGRNVSKTLAIALGCYSKPPYFTSSYFSHSDELISAVWTLTVQYLDYPWARTS